MSKIQVVLAEHDATIMGSLKDYILNDEKLDLAGYANNGMEAWNMIINTNPDVVVMELLMPYMDGFELLDRINRCQDLKKKPKIIVTSTMSNEAIVKESFKLGASYFIIKPYDVNCIVKRIKQICVEFEPKEGYAEISMDVKSLISRNLNGLGIPASLKGYQYIVAAVEEVVKDPSMMYGVTKILYPLVAKKYQSTSVRVEKAMRHAIEVAWTRNSSDDIKRCIGDEYGIRSKRPTNSEFIALMAQKVRPVA